MTNLEKYNMIFEDCFGVQLCEINCEELSYQSINEWDSVGHMNLISAIEEEFDVMLDTEDIMGFSSYVKGIEILSKYQIEVG